MQKFIVLLLLLNLFSVTLQKSDQKEVTIPVSSPIQLECDDAFKVNNIEVTIRRINTTCLRTIPECILPNDAIENIKKSCNNQVSCDVDMRNITNLQSCLLENGYFNVRYACKTIIDYSCDFDSSLCNWSLVPNKYGFRWERGLLWTGMSPVVEHTSASRSGKYVYITFGGITGSIAILESGQIIASEQQCFSFWYFSTNYRDSVRVLQNNDHLLYLSNKKYRKDMWHHIKIPLKRKAYKSFKLILRVRRGPLRNGLFGAIVIDDIVIENKNCDSSILMCDFETKACGSSDGYLNPNVWKIQNGEPVSPNSGPLTDHTTASGSGSYIFLNGRPTIETAAYFEIRNLDIKLSGISCLTFWYHMYSFYAHRKEGLKVKIDDTLVWMNFDNQHNTWIKATIDLDLRKISKIKFIGFLGDNWSDDIAVDDISLTEGTCQGLIDYEDVCLDLNDEASTDTYCPKGYIDFTNASLSFDPEKKECSEHYEKTRTHLLRACKDQDDNSQDCSIDPSTDLTAKPECFQLHQIRIRYTCDGTTLETTKARDTTTVLSDITSKEDITAAYESTTVVTSVRDSAAESTTVSLDISSIGDSVTVKGVPLPTNVNDSSDSEIGLVAGLVIAGVLLICLVILIVVLVRRHINRIGLNEKVRNELRENDYIGSQDIALPQTAGRSKQQNVGLYGQRSSCNTTANTEINNVQHTCSNLGTHKEFESPPYAARRDETFADKQTSNGDEYAMVGPIAETSFSQTIHSKTETPDSAFAKPVLETENKIDDEDQYALSEEGVYDHSGNNRHKELGDNIYNHAVDNIYDSGCHKRKDDGREDTYDHFFGQKTEDDYDITTTT
ncbi:uncharacterized protein [Mytilus edulis]|uniref:uncharacterized protein n=1 Tax=Mytilus edulis TaxID=6550 RepID=UPI0039F02A3D